jgi:hypothetical protein
MKLCLFIYHPPGARTSAATVSYVASFARELDAECNDGGEKGKRIIFGQSSSSTVL